PGRRSRRARSRLHAQAGGRGEGREQSSRLPDEQGTDFDGCAAMVVWHRRTHDQPGGTRAIMMNEDIMSAVYPSLRDRAVVVTGGASGIGAGLVGAFAAQGARVHFVDVLDAEGAALAGSLGASSRHAPVYRRCDLTDLD